MPWLTDRPETTLTVEGEEGRLGRGVRRPLERTGDRAREGGSEERKAKEDCRLATGGRVFSSPLSSLVDVFHLGFSPTLLNGGDIALVLGLSSPGPKKELVNRGVT